MSLKEQIQILKNKTSEINTNATNSTSHINMSNTNIYSRNKLNNYFLNTYSKSNIHNDDNQTFNQNNLTNKINKLSSSLESLKNKFHINKNEGKARQFSNSQSNFNTKSNFKKDLYFANKIVDLINTLTLLQTHIHKQTKEVPLLKRQFEEKKRILFEESKHFIVEEKEEKYESKKENKEQINNIKKIPIAPHISTILSNDVNITINHQVDLLISGIAKETLMERELKEENIFLKEEIKKLNLNHDKKNIQISTIQNEIELYKSKLSFSNEKAAKLANEISEIYNKFNDFLKLTLKILMINNKELIDIKEIYISISNSDSLSYNEVNTNINLINTYILDYLIDFKNYTNCNIDNSYNCLIDEYISYYKLFIDKSFHITTHQIKIPFTNDFKLKLNDYKDTLNIIFSYIKEKLNMTNKIINENDTLTDKIIQITNENNILNNRIMAYKNTSSYKIDNFFFSLYSLIKPKSKLEIDNLKSKITAFEKEKEEKTEEVLKLKMKLKEKEEEIGKMKMENQKELKDLSNYINESIKLKEDISEKEKNIIKLEFDNKVLKGELLKVESILKEKKANSENINDFEMRLNKEILLKKEKEEQIKSIELRLNSILSENENLKKEKLEFKSEANYVKDRMTKIKNDYLTEKGNYESQINKLNNEILKLKQEYESEARNEKGNKNERLNEEIIKVTKEIDKIIETSKKQKEKKILISSTSSGDIKVYEKENYEDEINLNNNLSTYITSMSEISKNNKILEDKLVNTLDKLKRYKDKYYQYKSIAFNGIDSISLTTNNNFIMKKEVIDEIVNNIESYIIIDVIEISSPSRIKNIIPCSFIFLYKKSDDLVKYTYTNIKIISLVEYITNNSTIDNLNHSDNNINKDIDIDIDNYYLYNKILTTFKDNNKLKKDKLKKDEKDSKIYELLEINKDMINKLEKKELMYMNLLKELNNLKNNSIIDNEKSNDNQSNKRTSQRSCTIVSKNKENIGEGSYKEAIYNLEKDQETIIILNSQLKKELKELKNENIDLKERINKLNKGNNGHTIEIISLILENILKEITLNKNLKNYFKKIFETLDYSEEKINELLEVKKKKSIFGM